MSEQLLTQILDELKGIKVEQGEMWDELKVIKSTMATKKDLEKVATTVNITKDQVAINSEKLDVLQDQQQLIKRATLDTQQDVSQVQGDITSLKDGQERQDKILESLSLRSLEQETDIRDLKRMK